MFEKTVYSIEAISEIILGHIFGSSKDIIRPQKGGNICLIH
jgi:hypothetical protein